MKSLSKSYSVLMSEEELCFFSQVLEDDRISKAGPGMLAAGVGMGVGGHYLGKRALDNYMTNTAEGLILISKKGTKNNILDSLIDSAKGNGTKRGIKESRKFWGNAGMRAAGVGLGIAGAGKITYDYLRNKKNQ